MRHSFAASFLLLGTTYAQLEIPIAKKSYAELGVNPARFLRQQRDTTTDGTNLFDIETYSTGGVYYCNITVGTPPQLQTVLIDTGSSDLYFDASTASACRSTTSDDSCRDGTFNKDSSSTYKELYASPAFNATYGDGSTAYGPYAQDAVQIGNIVIENMQFGLATTVLSTTGHALGLMGVGYTYNEAVNPRTPTPNYPNVPQTLVEAGVIESRVYSVYLNDAGYGSGSILFGGVDTSKYSGNLVTLNLLENNQFLTDESYDFIYEFITTVTDLSTTVGGKSTTIFSGGVNDRTVYTSSQNKALAVLLDTGSTAWSVPTSVYNQIVSQFTYIDSQGLASCSHLSSGDSITLTFGSAVQINVPIQEFLIPYYDPDTNQPVAYDSKNQACAFMISPSKYAYYGVLTLGDAVLRSMYVVFDLDNAQVSIAQAQVNSTASPNIVKVGTSGVPGAISGAKAPSAKQTVPLAEPATATVSYTASTAQSTIGTETGINALPLDARPSPSASGTSSSGKPNAGGSVLATSWTMAVALAVAVVSTAVLM